MIALGRPLVSSTPRGQLPGWIEAARPAQLGEVDGSANWYELAGVVATADEAGLRAVPTIGARALHPTTTDTRSIAAHDQPDRPSHPDAGRTLEVAEDRRCDHALMTICGELTVDGVGTITRALNELLLGHGNVVVDLSHLRVGWVPATQVFPSTLAAAGGWPFARLVLFGATADVAQVLYAVGVTDTVPLAADRAAALARLDTRPPTVARFHVLEPHLAAPRRARALFRRACLEWAVGGAYDEAALVVTELVTNAVRHAGTSCRLAFTLDDRGLHVAVRDRGPLRPALLHRCPTHLGSGLRVVATLAHRWGVLPHSDGKTVWAHFPARDAQHDSS